jgi:hypothetical protein
MYLISQAKLSSIYRMQISSEKKKNNFLLVVSGQVSLVIIPGRHLLLARLFDWCNVPYLLGTSDSQFITGFTALHPEKYEVYARSSPNTIFQHFLDATCPAQWIGRGGPVTSSSGDTWNL